MEEQELAGALRAARNGDEAGFAALWQAYQPAVLRYLRVVAGESAEDAASETWLHVARDLSGFRGDLTAFRVWLFRIARHRGIDDQRRVGRRREDLMDPGTIDGGTSPDAAADALERLGTGWAVALIATLPRDQAEAVMLRVVAGLDVAGTAEVLGKRPGAVRVATLRGLRRLADNVEVRTRRPATPAPLSTIDTVEAEGV